MSSLRPTLEAQDDILWEADVEAIDAALVAYLTAQLDLLAAGDGPKDYDQGPGYTRALDDVRRLLE